MQSSLSLVVIITCQFMILPVTAPMLSPYEARRMSDSELHFHNIGPANRLSTMLIAYDGTSNRILLNGHIFRLTKIFSDF